MNPDPINWTIDGVPVRMADSWTCNMVAPGGYDRFDGLCDATHLDFIGQGSVLTGFRPGQRVMWSGFLVKPPKLQRDGTFRIVATGAKALLEGHQERLPFQIRDYALWTLASGQPYGYTANINNSITYSAQPGVLAFSVADSTTITTADINPAVLWVPNNPLVAYGFDAAGRASGNWDLRVYTATGPSGSKTQILSQNLAAASYSFSLTGVSTSDDMLMITLYRSGGSGTTVGDVTWNITNLRANFLSAADSMSSSEIVVAIGLRAGFDTSGVSASAANALPFDWTNGTWADALSYLATLDDWIWVAREDRGLANGLNAKGWALDYRPWGERASWIVSTDTNVQEDLDDQALYDSVVVRYMTIANLPAQIVLNASPDPLLNPYTGTAQPNTDYEDLSDPQADSTLPLSVATKQLAYLSKPRVAGRITVGALEAIDGLHSPYALQAGDLVTVRDYRPAIPPQRVVGVTYGPRGSVQADIGMDQTAAGLIAKAALAAERV